MRGTNTETRLRKIRGREVSFVESPAIGNTPAGRNYCLIKSEQIPEGETIVDADQKQRDMIKSVLLEVLKSPEIANDKPFPEPKTNEAEKEAVAKSLKGLVAKSPEWTKDARQLLAIVTKFHGVEGPEVSDDEDEHVSPAMKSMMEKMDGMIGAVTTLASAIQQQNAKPAAPSVKKDEVDQEKLEAVRKEQAELKRGIAVINWNIKKQSGLDPGPHPDAQ